MILENECIKIGTKYYLVEDVQSILDARIKNVIPDDLE